MSWKRWMFFFELWSKLWSKRLQRLQTCGFRAGDLQKQRQKQKILHRNAGNVARNAYFDTGVCFETLDPSIVILLGFRKTVKYRYIAKMVFIHKAGFNGYAFPINLGFFVLGFGRTYVNLLEYAPGDIIWIGRYRSAL